MGSQPLRGGSGPESGRGRTGRESLDGAPDEASSSGSGQASSGLGQSANGSGQSWNGAGQGPLLVELGRRLRRAREARGLSVVELARRAGVSRRYVTEAEAGRANPTITKLAELAAPLGLTLGRLCDLPLASRGERVALVGLRGAGKSTIGRLLARELDARFVELDERIEARAGLSLAEIFDLHGAAAYRRHEREALEEVLAEGQRIVVAAGGSIVTSEESFERLRESCRTVWLHAAPETHLARVKGQGDGRPMAGRPRALDELREILRKREPSYSLCEFHVDTDARSAADTAADVAARLGLARPARA